MPGIQEVFLSPLSHLIMDETRFIKPRNSNYCTSMYQLN